MQDIFLLPDVAFEGGAADRGRDRFGAGVVKIDNHYLGGAGVMKGLAERLADAIAASGHDHDFAGDVHRYRSLILTFFLKPEF
jgi:hypothetical protein